MTLEDLGVAGLLLGQSIARPALALVEHGPVDVSNAPNIPLQDCGDDEHRAVVDVIMALMDLDGFGPATATKALHPKRPSTVPVIDSQAIYGCLLSDSWESGELIPTSSWSRRRSHVVAALETIYRTVADPANAGAWSELEAKVGTEGFSRIELFDMAWWAFIHEIG